MHLVIGFVKGSKTKPNRTLNVRCFQRFEEVTCNCYAFCLVHHAVCSRCDWSKYICRSSFYHLRNLSRIRKYLTKESAAVVVHALVTSKLDYCNAYNQNCRHFKIEICGRFSVLRWFNVGHVVSGQSVLALDWHEWCSCKGRERKIFCCALISRCRQNLKFGNFTSSFGSQKMLNHQITDLLFRCKKVWFWFNFIW